jgi:hypothetical protein
VPSEYIQPDVVRIALDRVEGFPFERFANAFYSSLVGVSFVPLGGVKDGGADARDGMIFEDGIRAGTYYQASVEVDAESKVRRTVARLLDFGRSPRTLVYLTPRSVKYSDRVERMLSDELDVTIIIRDGDYIALHINDDAATRAAFDEYLKPYTSFLSQVGASRLITPSRYVRTPAVYVFLAQEIDRQQGNESLVNSVTDALALWALEGTDPDAGILRTEEEVLERIVHELPSVRNMVAPRLPRRLKAMAKREYPGGRAVRWHRADDAFCLPFETRARIEEENTSDEALRLRVLKSLDDRLRSDPIEGLGDVGIRQAAEVALRTMQLTFAREGLEFASFLRNSNGNGQYSTITDALREALREMGHAGKHGQPVGDGAFVMLRGALYDSREEERQYLQRLSRTYALLFTLNTEPRLLEFFQEMTGDFRLYVGADQIIRALSEHYLHEPDQMTRNTLLLAARMGAKLILTEPVLSEVVHHFRGADLEYRNYISDVEHRLDYDFAREAPQIMLRAYLYARLNSALGSRQPRNWPGFVQQFCTHSTLHRPEAFDDIRQYLQITFGFTYESTADLENLVDLGQVAALAEQLGPTKKDPKLARNDALLALAVYGRRRRGGETSRVTEFGWGTWWLTGETAIVKLTRDIVRENSGRYIMRPAFLLNFLTLAPSALTARQAFATVFPSMLGIKLARRMPAQTFDAIMDKMAEAEELDDARRTVEIGKLANRLKSDLSHQYIFAGNAQLSAPVDLAAERDASPTSVQTHDFRHEYD